MDIYKLFSLCFCPRILRRYLETLADVLDRLKQIDFAVISKALVLLCAQGKEI